MAVFNLFSKRKAAGLGPPQALQSEDLPPKFRAQVVHLLIEAIGKWSMGRYYEPISCPANDAWQFILSSVCREHGILGTTNYSGIPTQQCLDYVRSAEVDLALDVIELSLQYVDRVFRDMRLKSDEDIDAVVEEFNVRCRENGVGYSYADGIIVPVSSSYVHTEVVEPALALLRDEDFRGPQDEFLKAHEHLRGGDFKNAIVEAGKAFESTMKAICTRKRWAYDAGATAKQLIATLLKNGFLPAYLETYSAHLRGVLETGVPVVRNKDGAHGQGEKAVGVPRELAEYALHLTAANIVFLVKGLKS